jgi:malate dehydrogenase
MLSVPRLSLPRLLANQQHLPLSLYPLSVATAALRFVLRNLPLRLNYSFLQIVPLLSQSSHPLPGDLAQDKYEALVKRIQFGGDEVVKAKDGAGSATLSMAYAGAEFATKVIRALNGEKGIVAPTYVNLVSALPGADALKKEVGVDYFSAPVELGVSVPALHIRI